MLWLAIFVTMSGVGCRSIFRRESRVAMGMFAVACATSHWVLAEELKPGIVLPSITHKWKLPGDETKAEITIDELSRCMGADFRIKDRLGEIKQQQKSLEMEHLEIGTQLAALQLQSAEVQRDQTSLLEAAKNHKDSSAELERRRASIEQIRAQQQLSAVEAKGHNALIAAYNKDVSKINKHHADLKLAANKLKLMIDKHNLAIEQHNNRVIQFNERNSVFRASADRYNEDIVSYQAQCAGERILIK